MATPTPGTFPSFPPYQPGALTYTGSEIVLIVSSATATAAATYYDLITNVVGKAPSVLPVTNPVSGDIVAFFQSATGLPKSCSVSQLGIPAGNLPVGGTAGQILDKNSGVNFDTGWVNLSSLVQAGTGIVISGSTTLTVAISTVGTAVLPGPFQVGSFTANGVIFGNGSSALGVTAAGSTGFPLLGNGTLSAPAFAALNLASGVVTGLLPAVNMTAANLASASVAGGVQGVLGVSSGGVGTTVLALDGLVIGNGSSAVGVVGATTAGFPLVANGSASAPGYQAANLASTFVTGVLNVTNGGLGTSVAGAAGTFLAGNGTTSVPKWVNGGLTLLNTITTTAGSTITDTTSLGTTFSNYLITIANLSPSTAAQLTLTVLYQGTTVFASANYVSNALTVTAATTVVEASSNSNTIILTGGLATTNIATAASNAANWFGEIRVTGNGTGLPTFDCTGAQAASLSGGQRSVRSFGQSLVTTLSTPITGFQLAVNAGTMSIGSVKVYGF